MSFSKALLLTVVLGTLTCFTSCEDTKKGADQKTESVASEAKKEVEENASEANGTTTSQETYPRISNENVVEFLTEYGANNPETMVRVTTAHGMIDIELYKDTPLHRANFVYLVKQGYFDGTFFHRVVPNFIIQAGNSDRQEVYQKRRALGKKYVLPAELENGRKHVYGTISGAKEYRENPDKNSAPFEFFIFLGEEKHTAHLNGNYTIFGRVIEGMDVVEKIANLPADEGEWPLENVYIEAKILQ